MVCHSRGQGTSLRENLGKSFFIYLEITSGFKAKECERELKTELAEHFCTSETAGEQSLKNTNVYAKLNALEHRAEICNRVSLVIFTA